MLDGVDQGLDGLVRPLPHVARDFRHAVDEEAAVGVEDGAVIGRAAVVDTNDNPSVLTWHRSSSFWYLRIVRRRRSIHTGTEGTVYANRPGRDHGRNDPVHRLRRSGPARRLFAFVAATTGSMFVARTTGEFPALADAEGLAPVETALAEAGPEHVTAYVGAGRAARPPPGHRRGAAPRRDHPVLSAGRARGGHGVPPGDRHRCGRRPAVRLSLSRTDRSGGYPGPSAPRQ